MVEKECGEGWGDEECVDREWVIFIRKCQFYSWPGYVIGWSSYMHSSKEGAFLSDSFDVF